MRAAGIILLLAASLSGCASIQEASAPISAVVAPPYTPDPIKIFSQSVYDGDVLICATAQTKHPPTLQAGGVGTATIDGATSSPAMAAINPWTLAAGAAGGLLKGLADGFGIASRKPANAFRNCMKDITRIDGSAVMYDDRD